VGGVEFARGLGGWVGGKTKRFIKTKSLGWAEEWVDEWVEEWVEGWVEGWGLKGEYRFSSLVK
jgi:hypothetical protein